jgi:hypothetical protein
MERGLGCLCLVHEFGNSHIPDAPAGLAALQWVSPVQPLMARWEAMLMMVPHFCRISPSTIPVVATKAASRLALFDARFNAIGFGGPPGDRPSGIHQPLVRWIRSGTSRRAGESVEQPRRAKVNSVRVHPGMAFGR